MKKGQSLFEVVIALAVITIILVALVTLASLSIRNTTFSKNRTSSTRYSQEAVEWLRGERDANWNSFISHAATPVRCLPVLDWVQLVGPCGSGAGSFIAGTPFRREVSFTTQGTRVEALVRVYWSDSQGTHETRTVADFTNWRNQ